MKIHKCIYAILVSVMSFLADHAFGQPMSLFSIPDYEAVITNKILLVYNPSISDESIISIIKNTDGMASAQMKKSLVPGRFLAVLNNDADRQAVKSLLENNPEIISATPWLKDNAGNERGILSELYIKPTSASDISFIKETVTAYHGEWKGERGDMAGIYEASFDKNSSYNAWEMALYLNTLPQVEFADINFAFFPKVHTNDSLFTRQWALNNTGGTIQWNGTIGADMEVVNAWTITTGDPSVIIAIMDSGIDTLHPDLKPNLLPGYDATGGNSHGYPNTNFPSDGHGTACAGIVAAKGNNNIGIAGVAYDCKLIPVKIFVYIDTTISFPPIIDTTLHEIPYSETSYMVAGTNWAWQMGNASVLSNSWGIPADFLPFAPVDQPVVSQAILDASQQGRNGKGTIPLFSSGNDNDVVIWPGGSPGTISVGATTNKDKRASFSNYGLTLDVSAPGVQVTTTDMLGANGFGGDDYMLYFGGTSAACPNAAGVAALILSEFPMFTFDEVKSLLRVSAEDVGGYNYDSTDVDGTWSPQLGYGRVNAYRALTFAPYLSTQHFEQQNVSILLYPNPTTDDITLMLRGFPMGTIAFEIIDISGKKVMLGKMNVTGENYSQTLSVSALSTGVYHLRLQGTDKPFHIKFIKK